MSTSSAFCHIMTKIAKCDDKNSSTYPNAVDPLNIIFNQYRCYPLQSKFVFFKSSIGNMFMKQNHKQHFLNIFFKIQKIYRAFSRIAHIYKFKKTPIRTTTDMYMNDLLESQKNVISIYQDNCRYLFCSTDLVKIINNSLSHSPFFYADPVPIKNPWNNIPFTKANLYNIYFFIRKYNCVMPLLFENYFLCNFNLTKFKNKYEHTIRDFYINSYVKNTPANILYIATCQMLFENNYRKRLKIHERFPIEKLIDIFRPYLLLFYKSKYSFGNQNKAKYEKVLRVKIKDFISFNPKFGQRYLDFFGNEQFNDGHIDFYSKMKNANRMQIFEVSHIEVNDAAEEDVYEYNYEDAFDW